ncbi:MAG: hypothetical protein AB7U85_06140 [Alphaproteobacteria bacterium]
MNEIVIIFVNVVLSVIVGAIGENRKFGFWGYFFASVLMTPIVGAMLVLASDAPPKITKVKIENE